MQLAWLTDVHLNFLGASAREQFAADVALTDADGVLITGDIAEADSLASILGELADIVSRPIWFVLGNHDFYGGAIAGVREVARRITAAHESLRWLPACGVVRLSDETALIGIDGWGDARLGNVERTPIELSDFVTIRDLGGLSRAERTARLRALGDEEAAALRVSLTAALATARQVVIATHVPPFRESCWHEGRISDDDWLPYFTCDAVGHVLRTAMAARPDVTATVLCGHTHGAGAVDILPNLRVLTGGAEYGAPVVDRVLDDPVVRVEKSSIAVSIQDPLARRVRRSTRRTAMLSRVLPEADETPESAAIERQRFLAAVRGSRERSNARAARATDEVAESDDLVTGFWMAA